MNNLQKPVARKEGLVIQEMPDELLVYDMKTSKAHCLNATAAAIWRACDGKNTISGISELLGKVNGKKVDDDIIWLAIVQLEEKKLLDYATSVNFDNQTRREIIKKIGLAAVIALPLITSLVAPKAVSAGSQCSSTCSCTLNASCPGDGLTACQCNAGSGNFSACPANCTTGCAACTVTAQQGNRFTCSSICT